MVKRIFFAVDVGGTKTKMLLSEGMRIKAIERIETPQISFIENLESKLSEFLSKNNCCFKSVYKAGFSLPGPFLSEEKMISVRFPNIENGRKILFEKKMKDVFSRMLIINDAISGAVAERKKGSLKNFKNALYLTWSTGVGGGLIIDDKIIKGKSGNCGHIGHTIVSDKRNLCGCGERGDIESICSGKSIEALYNKSINPEEIFLRYHRKEKKAVSIINDAVKYFSRGIYNAVTMLDLDAVCVGGAVFLKNHRTLLPMINNCMQKHKNPQVQGVKILKAALGEDSSLFGALFCLLEKKHRPS